MSTQATAKLLVKSTTKLSLNERFTNMLKNKQPPAVNVRATVQQQHASSAQNRRLAQQMEHRPSVQAALQNKPVKTLKQRLGVQARLGRPVVTTARGGVGTRGFAAVGFRGMMRGGFRGRGRGAFFKGAMHLGGVMRGRGGVIQLAVRSGLRQRGGQVSRTGALVRRGARPGIGGRGRGMGFLGRGAFVSRGGARSRGRGRGAGHSTLTREQLDNQLDDYMSKTKGHLDAELDAYMAQADDME